MEDFFVYPLSVGIYLHNLDEAFEEKNRFFAFFEAHSDASVDAAFSVYEDTKGVHLLIQTADNRESNLEEFLIQSEMIRTNNIDQLKVAENSSIEARLQKAGIETNEGNFRLAFSRSGALFVGLNESTIESSEWLLYLHEDGGGVASELVRIPHPKLAMASELRGVRVLGSRTILFGEWLTQNCSFPVIYEFGYEAKELLSPQRLWTILLEQGICQTTWQELSIDDELTPEGVAIHDVYIEDNGTFWIAAEHFGETGFTALLLAGSPEEGFTLVSSREARDASAFSKLICLDGSVFFSGRVHENGCYTLFIERAIRHAGNYSLDTLWQKELPEDVVGDIAGFYEINNRLVLLFYLQGEVKESFFVE